MAAKHMRIGLAGLCLAATVGVAGEASAAVIAHWRFESDAFTADSSGNGYHLNNFGAVASSDVSVTAPPGSTSALFDGGDRLATAVPIDFAGARHVRLSWLMKYTGTGAGIIFETSPNFNDNAGGMLVDVSEFGDNTGEAGIRLPSSYNLDRFAHGSGTVPAWEAFAIEIDLDSALASDVVKVYRNGVLQPDVAAYGFHDLPPANFDFLNAAGNIGARANGAAGFVGYLDELKLETVEVPEPASLALAGAGVLLVVGRPRRA